MSIQCFIFNPNPTQKRVNELTKGRSLEANIALVKSNAVVGAKVAVELSKVRTNEVLISLISYDSKYLSQIRSNQKVLFEKSDTSQSPLVIGGAVLDTIAKPSPGTNLQMETSNPGIVKQSWGGFLYI